MLNNLGFNGKNPLIYHIYTKTRPSLNDEDIAVVGKAIVGESKVSDEHVAFEAGMKQVRSMYFNGKLVYNYMPCEKLELNARELVLTNTVDNSFKLSVKVTPSNCTEEVTFTSSNTNVATVNIDGSIHPVSLGTCDIIVTCDKKSVVCKVHVKEQTLYLYNRGVVNNNSEFGQIVHPSDTSKFSYASDNIFLKLAGSTSNYGTIWFSWANRVDFGEYDVMHMDITNTTDHSTIIGLTRNNKTGQQGYQNGNPTDVDGTTFVEDRTVIALKQGVNKHSLDVDLVNGEGYLGLYFKRNTDSGDSAEEYVNVNTIYLIRKSVYVLGTGVDTSEEVNVPCTGLSFTQDEIELEYTSNFMYNLNTLLNITPQNCDETVQWTVLDDGDNVMSVNESGYLNITGVGSAHVQAICGKYFDSIRVNTVKSCSGISLEQSSYTLDLSGTSATLVRATVVPSDTTDTITWKSSDTSVVNVTTTGLITAQGVGTATLTATCGDRTATCTVTVKASCTELLLGTSVGTLDVSGTKTTTLQVSKTPSNTTDAVTWESSNINVATVSNGTVTAIAPGTVTITARCGSKSASHTLTVKASCTGVSLSKSTYTLDISGTDSVTFTPTINPSNTTDSITWKSSNTSVATVNATSGGTKGTIFAKSAGTANITVTCGSKSASVTVTVKASCTGLSLNKSSLSFTLLNVTQTLTATITPSSTTDTVSWKSSNTAVATVSNGVVRSEGDGSCTITASCGSKTASCTVIVDAIRPCTSLKLDPVSLTVNVGDSVALGSNVIANVQPTNCTDTITSYTAGGGGSGAVLGSTTVSGVYQALKAGTDTLYVKCGEKTATCAITVNNPNPYLVLSATNSYMAVGEQHTFYADLYNGNIDNLIINLSRPDSYTLTYSKLSSTRVAVTITMLKDESGTVNFNYNSQLLDRFEIYVRV